MRASRNGIGISPVIATGQSPAIFIGKTAEILASERRRRIPPPWAIHASLGLRMLRIVRAEQDSGRDVGTPLPDHVVASADAGDPHALRVLRRHLRIAERALGIRHRVRLADAPTRAVLRARVTGRRVAHRVGRPAPSRTASSAASGSSEDGPPGDPEPPRSPDARPGDERRHIGCVALTTPKRGIE